LAPLALSFPAHGLEAGTAPFFTLGNEESFLLHVRQDASLGYLLAKAWFAITLTTGLGQTRSTISPGPNYGKSQIESDRIENNPSGTDLR
jgi:hypothetical protein